MEPLAVELLLLRSLETAELRIAPGRVLMARIVRADASGRGALSIAGAVIEAELPKDVRQGQDIRLVVTEVTPERVVLSMSDPTAFAPTPAPIELPGGGTIRLTEHGQSGHEGTEAAGHSITLRYDAPALGAVDLRFDLDPGSLRVTAALSPGEPVALAQQASDVLREALAASSDRPVSVVVSARYEPLDLYA